MSSALQLFEMPPDSAPATSSSGARRASRSQAQASVKALMTAVTCGLSSSESSLNYSPDGSWRKTSRGLFSDPEPPGIPGTSLDWPYWGTASDGECWALTRPVDVRCKETGCSPSASVWLRPMVGHEGAPFELRRHDHHGLDIWAASAHWPRPRADKNTPQERDDFTPNLAARASVWPRPLQRDGNGPKEAQNKMGGPNLPHLAITWARPDRTPDAPDSGSNSTQVPGLGNQAVCFSRLLGKVERPSGHGSELSISPSGPPSPERKRLNYRFVEWLMGFPYGWLDLPWLTRAKRLKMLGNAVNMWQALPFLEAIAEDIRTEVNV